MASLATITASSTQNATTRSYAPHILLLALALRLILVWTFTSHQAPDWFFSQASELGQLAQSLLSGKGLSSPFGGATGPSAFLAPGYPAIVAAVFRVFHPFTHASMLALMLLQTLFSIGTIWATMRIASRLFDNTIANAAGLIWALSPPLLWLPSIFWETSLSIFLLTALFALALACDARPTYTNWITFGLTGLIALAVNPSLAPMVLGFMAWAAYASRKHSKAAPAAGILLCLALFTLWPIRNYRAMHAFIPLRSNLGYELWQGNRPGADGFFSADLHPNVNATEFARYQSLGELPYMQEKSKLAKATIAAHPGHFVLLSLKRAAYFWTGIGRTSSALGVLHVALTTLLGACGLALLWQRSRRLALLFLLPLAVFPLPYYITHPDLRFRLVLDPLLTILAVYAITRRKIPADQRPNS